MFSFGYMTSCLFVYLTMRPSGCEAGTARVGHMTKFGQGQSHRVDYDVYSMTLTGLKQKGEKGKTATL